MFIDNFAPKQLMSSIDRIEINTNTSQRREVVVTISVIYPPMLYRKKLCFVLQICLHIVLEQKYFTETVRILILYAFVLKMKFHSSHSSRHRTRHFLKGKSALFILKFNNCISGGLIAFKSDFQIALLRRDWIFFLFNYRKIRFQ